MLTLTNFGINFVSLMSVPLEKTRTSFFGHVVRTEELKNIVITGKIVVEEAEVAREKIG